MNGLGCAAPRTYTEIAMWVSVEGGRHMTKIRSPRSATWALVSGFLVCVSLGISAAADKEKATPTSDRRLDMVAELQATSPHASLGDERSTLGRVVGTWDVEYTDYSKDGTASHRTGQFIVGWVLDGRAVQDLWIVNPTAARKDREVYTTLYYFEPKSRSWHATFVDPEHGSVLAFTGRPAGNDRFVLETQDSDSKTTRWSFNDIRSDSFVWRDEQSSDGGKTWQLKSEYHMNRHAG
jgi:hypothetical protein